MTLRRFVLSACFALLVCFTPTMSMAVTCSTSGVDTTLEFFSLLDCLLSLEMEHSLNHQPAAVASRLAPYQPVFDSARGQLNTTLVSTVYPAMTPAIAAEFEDQLTSSGILREMDAYISFLNSTPSNPSNPERAAQDDANAKSQSRDSLKKMVDKLLSKLKDSSLIPDWVVDSVQGFVDVIFEILEIMGKKAK